jgi:tripartite-type tricarboxylate transporter receptor subunit TctC
VARIIGEKLRGPLGQTVIVENKPGAGGRLAAEALKHSAPDGQTYMLAPNATGVFQALLYPVSVLHYDLLNDLAPVAVVVSYPLALAVGTKTGVHNLKEYVAWLKANPQQGPVRLRGPRRTHPLQRPAARQGRGRRAQRRARTRATARSPPTCSADRCRPAS